MGSGSTPFVSLASECGMVFNQSQHDKITVSATHMFAAPERLSPPQDRSFKDGIGIQGVYQIVIRRKKGNKVKHND